jgi:hypothetical protein
MGSGIAPVPAPDAAAGDGVLEGARERFDVLIFLVPEVGVEPTLPEGNGILSPARLPVSPLRHREEGPLQYTALVGAIRRP